MIAPALTAIGDDLKIHSDIILSMTVSVFVLAYSVGPLVLGPLSEMYGRVPVLQLSNMLYLVFNICCGFAQTQNEMIAFRFLSGLGGSAPLAVRISPLILTRESTTNILIRLEEVYSATAGNLKSAALLSAFTPSHPFLDQQLAQL